MPIPAFLAELRELLGTRPLWLMSTHAAVTNSAGDVLPSPTFTYPSGDRAQYLDLIFRCSHVSGHANVADDESTAVEWFSPHRLPVLDQYQRRQVEIALGDVPQTVFVSMTGHFAFGVED